jgi:3-oxoacyl-[acyl-carrier-protein] synthase II
LNISNLPLKTNVAVIFSTVSNDTEFLEEVFPKILDNKRVNPFKVVNRIPDMVSSHICSHYQFMGTSLSLFASCGTGLLSIDYAMRLCDEYDYVIVGSGDASVFRVAMKYFNVIGAIGNLNCPFDDEREGFVMGEGAGCLILQSLEKVKEYESKVYAKLYPVGSASDAYDLTSPANDGRGAKMSMGKALKYVDRIDAVSAHATSTPIGDPIEYNAIIDKLGSVPIYAPKSKIGHTLAGAGILEAIIAIESMRNGIIPHCQNLINCSFDENNLLVREPKSVSSDIIRTLNNSFGFGGKCASQVIEVNRNE